MNTTDNIPVAILKIKDINHYKFYMETGKVLTKARKDVRFKPLTFPFDISSLEDGMYVGEFHMLFLYRGDWILIHGDEPGHMDSLQATDGIVKVLRKYFKIIEEGTVFRARIMKSYLHVFMEPLPQKNCVSIIRHLKKEDQESLSRDFETLPYKTFTGDEWYDFYTKDILASYKAGAWYCKVDGALTLCVMDENGDGFSITIGQWREQDNYATLDTVNKQDLDIFDLFQKATGTPIPCELKRMISFIAKESFVYTH